jgi:hypothetical protein
MRDKESQASTSLLTLLRLRLLEMAVSVLDLEAHDHLLTRVQSRPAADNFLKARGQHSPSVGAYEIPLQDIGALTSNEFLNELL